MTDVARAPPRVVTFVRVPSRSQREFSYARAVFPLQPAGAMRTFTRALLTLLMFVPLTVAAQESGEMPQAPKTTDAPRTESEKKQKLTKDDLQTMAHYRAVNNMEIELGKVAQKNAGSQAVKEYGAMMVKEHGDHDKQLTAFAKQTKQKIPAYKPPTEAEKQEIAMAKKHAAEIKKLSGADFDREYLRMMVEDHDRELAKIDANIAKTQNTQLAELLKETKPILQKHADQARELQKSSAQASR